MALDITRENIVGKVQGYLNTIDMADYPLWLSIKEGNSDYLEHKEEIAKRFNVTGTIPSVPKAARTFWNMASNVLSLIPQIKIDNNTIQKEWDRIWRKSYRSRLNAVCDSIAFGLGYLVLTIDDNNIFKIKSADPYLAFNNGNVAIYLERNIEKGVNVAIPFSGYVDTNARNNNLFCVHLWTNKKYYYLCKDSFNITDYNYKTYPIVPLICMPSGEDVLRGIALYQWIIGLQQSIDMSHLSLLSSSDQSIFPKIVTNDDSVTVDDIFSTEPKILHGDAKVLDFPDVQGDFIALENNLTDTMYHVLGINRLSAGAFIPDQQISGVALQLLLQTAGNTIGEIAQSIMESFYELADMFVETSFNSESDEDKKPDIDFSTSLILDKRTQFLTVTQLAQALKLPPGFLIRLSPDISDSVKAEIEGILDAQGGQPIEPGATLEKNNNVTPEALTQALIQQGNVAQAETQEGV